MQCQLALLVILKMEDWRGRPQWSHPPPAMPELEFGVMVYMEFRIIRQGSHPLEIRGPEHAGRLPLCTLVTARGWSLRVTTNIILRNLGTFFATDQLSGVPSMVGRPYQIWTRGALWMTVRTCVTAGFLGGSSYTH